MLNYIIGIDIGNHIGIGIYGIDDNLKIRTIETKYFYIPDLLKHKDDSNFLNNLLILEDNIRDLINQYQPIMLGVETGYMGSFAKAFKNITIIVHTIKRISREFRPYLKTVDVSPLETKRSIKCMTNDKDAIYQTLIKMNEINDKINLHNLNEHELDSVAIAYHLLKLLRENKAFLFNG